MNNGEDIGINDGINVSTTKGEADGNTDGNKDRLEDDEDEGNVSKADGIKNRIFEG